MTTADVRMVSQLACTERTFSYPRVFGTVVTYTSKNELITFNVTEAQTKEGLAYTTTTIEEQFLNLSLSKPENCKEIWSQKLLSRLKPDSSLQKSSVQKQHVQVREYRWLEEAEPDAFWP